MYRMKLLCVMILWGSLGVFTKAIPLSALSLAFLRALIALPVLGLVIIVKKKSRPNIGVLKPYLISGMLLGFGWLTLFLGFKNTSVSSAVIVYNMCPVYVMIAAPFFLKETITKIQSMVIVFSFIGLCMIVGNNLSGGYGYLGLALSALSGVCYAAIVMINRSIKVRIDNQMATFIQILVAMLVLLPFVLLEGHMSDVFSMNGVQIGMTLLLGVLHTGVAYTLFFSVYEHMKSIEVVAYSYFEPLFGVMLSMLFLGETLSVLQIIGGGLILGSTYVGEMLKVSIKTL